MGRREHRIYSKNRILSRLPFFLSFFSSRLPATTGLRFRWQRPPCSINYRFLDDRVDACKETQRLAESLDCAATSVELECFGNEASLTRLVPVFVEIEC